MPIRLYLDEDAMDDDLVQALRLRGVDVETALDAHLAGRSDDEQLAYAVSVGRTLYTFNVSDFMTLHSAYMQRDARTPVLSSGNSNVTASESRCGVCDA